MAWLIALLTLWALLVHRPTQTFVSTLFRVVWQIVKRV